MEMAQQFILENFLSSWNENFPNYSLTTQELKTPHTVVGAVLHLFDRLGIDRDAVLSPPPEDQRNEHTVYYWDLLPVINLTRVINHIVSVMPQVTPASVAHLLQPTTTLSHSILVFLFNLMVFNEDRLRNIAPYEEELFARTNQVKSLEERKNKLLEMLNEQAEEKGKRAERLEKIEKDIKQFEEEMQQEKEEHDKEKQEFEAILKENHQAEILLEQKKTHRDTLLAEVERKKALRVYDAEDIRAQAEQSARGVHEAERRLDALQAALLHKEAALRNLLALRPGLEHACHLLHDIARLAASLQDIESGDLESESKEGELEMLHAECEELRAQLSDTQQARGEAAAQRHDAAARRQHERTLAQSLLRETEEKDKKNRERSKKAAQRTEEIKKLTLKFEEEKAAGLEELAEIERNFSAELKSVEDTLLKKAKEVEKRLEDKLRNRHV